MAETIREEVRLTLAIEKKTGGRARGGAGTVGRQDLADELVPGLVVGEGNT